VKSSCLVKVVVWEHLVHAHQHAAIYVVYPKTGYGSVILLNNKSTNGALNLLVTWTTIEIISFVD
jgi:trehalose utilization protein